MRRVAPSPQLPRHVSSRREMTDSAPRQSDAVLPRAQPSHYPAAPTSYRMKLQAPQRIDQRSMHGGILASATRENELIVADDAGLLRTWKLDENSVKTESYCRKTARVVAMAGMPNGSVLAGATNGDVRALMPDGEGWSAPLANVGTAVQSLVALTDDLFIAGTWKGELLAYRRENDGWHQTGSLELRGPAPSDTIPTALVALSGEAVVFSTSDGDIGVWDVSSNERRTTHVADTLIWSLAGLDSSTVAVGTSLGKVHIFDTNDMTEIRHFRAHNTAVKRLSAHDDHQGEKVLLTGSEKGNVRSWDATGRKLSTKKLKRGPVTSLDVHADVAIVGVQQGGIYALELK